MDIMQAAVLHNFNDLRLESVPIPNAAQYGEVVVNIKSCGLCATDFKAITGIRKNVKFPFIAGHEPSGIISQVGPGVENFKVGDEVIIQPSGYCGNCHNCHVGNTHYCEYAFTTGGDGPDDVWPGAFAEYMKTTASCLYHKPAGIGFDAAALTEPLSGAWKGLIQYSQMQIGDNVVVIGVGGIGLLCMMVAKAAGAGRLIAIDISEHALNNATKLGATHTVNAKQKDIKKQIYDILPHGPDVIIEAAGSIEAVRLMVELLRRGTRWNIFGITTHEKFELNGGYAHFLEARMDASFGTTPLAMTKSIRLMESKLVDVGKIITHRFPLAKIHEAIELMKNSQRNKVIINP
ncbi:MAG: zinc-dependent alcohol dehydrogenase [Sedimentisphaerales bacterium]